MSKKLKKHQAFLQLLSEKISVQQRRAILQTTTPEQIKVLSEIAANVINGSLILPNASIRKLVRYKHLVQLLSDTSLSRKKEALKKQSLGLVTLLQVVTPALRSLIQCSTVENWCYQKTNIAL